MSENIWTVKIGGITGPIPSGGDAPMRRAISQAFQSLTGWEPEYIFSGWGGELTEGERAVVENREPGEDAMLAEAAELRKQAEQIERFHGVSSAPSLDGLRAMVERWRAAHRMSVVINGNTHNPRAVAYERCIDELAAEIERMGSMNEGKLK